MLEKRSVEREDLDNLELAGPELEKTLKDLTKINTYLGNTRSTLRELKEIVKSHPKQKLHIVDLGCGAADNLIAIGHWCNSNHIPITLTGIDGNVNCLNYAKRRSDLPINFIQADLLDEDFILPKCDVLISSHFIYHYSDQEIVNFLNKFKESVSEILLFSELRRSVTAYVLFRLFGFFLPIGKMARTDGLKAIRRAFKKEELVSILSQSNSSSFTIKNKRFFRLLVLLK